VASRASARTAAWEVRDPIGRALASVWPWAKSQRGFRWALPEDEAPVSPPKIATLERREAPSRRTGGKASRLASATEMPVTRLRRSAAPWLGAEDARRRQGYGGLAHVPAEASAKAGCERSGSNEPADSNAPRERRRLPADAKAMAGLLTCPPTPRLWRACLLARRSFSEGGCAV
jgi:hypothetical protein